MSVERFDNLVRGLATNTSRRTVLRALAAAATGGVLTVLGVRSADARQCRADGAFCTGKRQCCSRRCNRVSYQCEPA